MNVKKAILLLLVVIFVAGMIPSCVTDADEIAVTLSIRAGDEKIFNTKINIVPTNDDGTCSVIDVVNNAIALYEVDIKLDTSGNSITKIKNYDSTSIDGIEYYWMYKINDVEPTTGKANTNYVKDGDTIEYLFYFSEPGATPQAQAKTGLYKSEWELFGEGEETTTQETESSESTAE